MKEPQSLDGIGYHNAIQLHSRVDISRLMIVTTSNLTLTKNIAAERALLEMRRAIEKEVDSDCLNCNLCHANSLDVRWKSDDSSETISACVDTKIYCGSVSCIYKSLPLIQTMAISEVIKKKHKDFGSW